jgi:hypothetical protein
MMMRVVRYLTPLLFGALLSAQVYSPKLLAEGQPDSSDMASLVAGIYTQAHAQTPREKAEAIWRFFLTDGRFVKPGFWYHIAGWSYEEPAGEVLDPIKLLNSYGFGLCYHIAPLLQAAFLAGGFQDARCWFLTGHTVTEVFYDGAYHYFDSDMMGYNVQGDGPFQGKPVVSVQQLERDSGILLGKLKAPNQVKPGTVDNPWYPADVNASAIGDLAALFTSANDNFLYSGSRYSSGHTMDFVLRPDEKLIRFFKPEQPGLYYLPYKFDGQKWTEFPQEFSEYQIRTVDGPRSQKDDRTWATGRIEYTPKQSLDQPEIRIKMPSPYVIIDANFKMLATLTSKQDRLRVETSVDGGQTWTMAGELVGPHNREWSTQPKVIVNSEHGRLTAVSGTYGYEVKITRQGRAQITAGSLQLVSRIELNPRSLPALHPGRNEFTFTSGPAVERIEIPAPLQCASLSGLEVTNEKGQGLLHPPLGEKGEASFVLEANGRTLTGFDAGARFLDLDRGVAPDKLTAETRPTKVITQKGDASIVWSVSPDGPFQKLWNAPASYAGADGESVKRLLSWPEAFRQVRSLPPGTTRVYLKLRTSGPAIDNIRLAVYAASSAPAGSLEIVQLWREGTLHREHSEIIDASSKQHSYSVNAGGSVSNDAVIFSAK